MPTHNPRKRYVEIGTSFNLGVNSMKPLGSGSEVLRLTEVLSPCTKTEHNFLIVSLLIQPR